MSASPRAQPNPTESSAGLEQLLEALRQGGFAISASEAIDATLVLRRLSERAGSAPDRAALKGWLRAALCKSRDQQQRFEGIFDAWMSNSAGSSTGPTSPGGGQPLEPPRPPERHYPKVIAAVLVVVVIGFYLMQIVNRPSQTPERPNPSTPTVEPQPQPQRDTRPQETAPAPKERFYGYFPAIRYNQQIRPVWIWSALGLPLLFLLPLLIANLATPRGLSRTRGGGRFFLDKWPPAEVEDHIVFRLPDPVAGQLQRHVPSRPGDKISYARRPLIDTYRTVQASLRNLGVPTPIIRHARLRPSYLILVEAERDEDLGIAWAKRLRAGDVHVDLYRFLPMPDGSCPMCIEVPAVAGSACRQLPFSALPRAVPGQRLIIVSDGQFLLDEQGNWREWALLAKLERWGQRALFSPIEPRDWSRFHLDALERRAGPADRGLVLLPFEESGLDAWSQFLARGSLPDIVLAEPQRYPRLLVEDAQRPDAEKRYLRDDAPVDAEEASLLVSQLQMYLGGNGFYWLCACAVPPVLHPHLVLLLGKRYFEQAGGTERLPYFVARNYRLLIRLPWLRHERGMPQWLRLALLARLPLALQSEIRTAVESAFAEKRLADNGEGIELSFEPPDGNRVIVDRDTQPRDALYVGFIKDKLDARQLMLRIPGKWNGWLDTVPVASRPRHVFAARLQAARSRLLFRDGLPHAGPPRLVLSLVALFVLLIAFAAGMALHFPHQNWPGGLRRALLLEQTHAVGYRHDGPVFHAAFSPDGTRIVTASSDGSARVWDAASGAALGAPLKHDGPVFHAAFSPDGTRIVTASSDGSARVWDAASSAALGALLKHTGPVNHAAFSPDGTRIVTASGDNTARVWDAASGAALGAPLKHDDVVAYAAFSPDGTRIVTASGDNTARVWDAASGAPLGASLSHEGSVMRAAFSPDGTRIVTASWDGSARIWNAANGAAVGAPLRHDDFVSQAAFSPDGTRIVTASEDGSTRVWDATSGAAVGAPLKHDGPVNHVAFNPDGTRIVTASRDNTTRVWDAASGAALGAPLRHDRSVNHAAFSPDGTRIVTASDDFTARIWDAASGAALGEALKHDGPVIHAAFSPGGTRIVTASADHTARVWDAASGAALSAPLKHDGSVYHAAFSPDGTRIVTASRDKTARVWDTTSGAALGAPLKHDSAVNHAVFSPSGTRIVTASADHTARVWDAASGAALSAPLKHDGSVYHAAFSPDGTRIVTASRDNTARVWDTASGAALGEALKHDGPVNHAAFSPDGTRIVTASWDGSARVWDATSGAALSAPLKHDGPVSHAAFSPDGTRTVTSAGSATDGAASESVGRRESASNLASGRTGSQSAPTGDLRPGNSIPSSSRVPGPIQRPANSPRNAIGSSQANTINSGGMIDSVGAKPRVENLPPARESTNRFPAPPVEPANAPPSGANSLDVRPSESNIPSEEQSKSSEPSTPSKVPIPPPQPKNLNLSPGEGAAPGAPSAPPPPDGISVPRSRTDLPTDLVQGSNVRLGDLLVKSAFAGEAVATRASGESGAAEGAKLEGSGLPNVSVTASATVARRENSAFIWHAPPAATPTVGGPGPDRLVRQWIGGAFDWKWLPAALAVIGLASGIAGMRALGKRLDSAGAHVIGKTP